MSEPKTPTSEGETEQVDSPTIEETESTEPAEDRSDSPSEESSRATGKGLGMTALIIALGALGLAVWQWYEATFDDAGANVRPAIADPAPRLADIEQSLASQEQSLQQLRERTSDERLESMVDGRIESRLNEDLDDRIDNRTDNRIDDRTDNRIDNRLNPVQQQIDRLAAEVNAMTGLASDLQSIVSELQNSVAEGERQREDLSARIDQAAGVQREADQELALRLAILEAVALLRFGQTQAELSGDYTSAAAAFSRAKSLLESNSDPRLGQSLQRVSVELEALQSSRGPDWAAAQLSLERLADRIESWPLAPTGNQPSSPDAPMDSESGWWAGMKSSLGQLVEVERRDPLELDAEQVNALREQLRLRLMAAELAIERRDTQSARRHLQNVNERIERHFDRSNSNVIEAQELLDEIQSLQPAEPPAGLGRALASLNQVLEAL